MNRYTVLLILPLLLILSSCKKVYVTPNRTIITNLASGNWIASNGGKNYAAAISMPEIDTYFNDYGAVLVYASFENNTYEQIPEVYDGIAYSYTHRPGQLIIEIQDSDGKSVISPPGGVKIKVVLVQSN